MPTTKRRIPVVRDDRLDRALRATRTALPEADLRSVAAQLRALALLGAEVATSDPAWMARAALDERLVARHGMRPPEAEGFAELLADLPEADAGEPRGGTAALEWVRGER